MVDPSVVPSRFTRVAVWVRRGYLVVVAVAQDRYRKPGESGGKASWRRRYLGLVLKVGSEASE